MSLGQEARSFVRVQQVCSGLEVCMYILTKVKPCRGDLLSSAGVTVYAVCLHQYSSSLLDAEDAGLQAVTM